ncbi:hypothetical protein ACTODO_01882 [Schaalia dentiphila ATCC 17982]|uniref:Uncharacterized protein n=1 Tax=Schaalia dentiphila ATCC 17982 TaxID=411466 RepID=A7BDY5_9ACTO|nr:hypothetical protein ACTODO_01882 [Schaalia odontolytica ATCC 17982]
MVSPHLFCHGSAHCSSSGLHFGDTVSFILRNQWNRLIGRATR